MEYIPFLNLDKETFKNIKKDENLLPYLYTGFRFADCQGVMPISQGGSVREESGKYVMSNAQKETISRYSIMLSYMRDLWGEERMEEALSSSFLFYLKKYGAPDSLSYTISEEFSYTESLVCVAEEIKGLLYRYSVLIGRKSRSYSISDILDIDSYFPAKYYIQNGKALDSSISLLFDREQKIAGERKFQGENNYVLLTKRKLKTLDIKTDAILSSLIQEGLVEVDSDKVLSLTAKSKLLAVLKESGVITLRNAEKCGLMDELDALLSSGELKSYPKFLTKDEKTFLEYLLSDRYTNSLNIPAVCLDKEKEYSERKAKENYIILLSVLIALSIKVIDEISSIKEGFFRKKG